MPGVLLNAETTTPTITSYFRCRGGIFDNPYQGTPQMLFRTEQIKTDASGNLISTAPQTDLLSVYDPAAVYQLYDPTTGEAIPGATMPAGQIYAVIYSLFRAAAAAADVVDP